MLDVPLLTRIVSFVCEDQNALCTLCVVNKTFNVLASRELYAKISISSQSDVQTLLDFFQSEAEDHTASALASSCLPRNAAHVQAFEVTSLIPSWPSQTDIPHALRVVLSRYANMRSFTWRPSFCDVGLTLAVTRLLPRLPSLQKLSIRVPFILPTPPSPKPASGLDVIAEEEEEEERKEGEVGVAHEDFKVDLDEDHDAIVEDSPPREYKPLEYDSDEDPMPKLSPTFSIPPRELTRLQCLILASPTPEVLVPLPDALQALERPIRTLCLEENCGSVTPGILTSLLPTLQALEHFGLGVAYSVKYDNLFPFLDGLPNMRKLELYHYPQLYRPIAAVFHLPTLKSLKIAHAHTTSRQIARNMCVWIRRLISSSPLAVLEIACEDDEARSPRGPGYGISYDGLVEHLLARHKRTLRVLRMPGAYLGTRAMRRLLGKEDGECKALEEVDVCVRRKVFDTLADLLDSSPRLRTVRLTVINMKRGSVLSIDQSILRGGSSILRSAVVSGQGFVGEWVTEAVCENVQQAQHKLRAVFRISEIKG